MAGSSAVDEAMDAFRAVARTFWGPLKKVVALGRGRSARLEERLARLEYEQAVRDAHITYVSACDSGDIDGILALFAEDALLIDSRGSFVGKQLIRQKRGLGGWILSDCAPARITTIESRLAREDWEIEVTAVAALA